jgi:uncharacterized protein YhjY with autotransporter beta-barrel domain
MNRLKCSAFACLLLPTISSAADITALDLGLSNWDIYGYSNTLGGGSVNTYTGSFSSTVNKQELNPNYDPSDMNSLPFITTILNYSFVTLDPSDVIATITPGDGDNNNESPKTINDVVIDVGVSLNTIIDATTGSVGGVGGTPSLAPTNFAYIAKDFVLSAGAYSFGWAYVANDYTPFADGIFFSYSDSSNPNNSDFKILARNLNTPTTVVGDDGYPAGTVLVESYGSTAFRTYSFNLATSSTYRLAFGAFNHQDRILPPIFILTDIAGNVIGEVVGEMLSITGPSVYDTEGSLANSARGLRGTFNLQSAVINAGLQYDCTTFDQRGICVSAGGRVTEANNPSTNSRGALLIASYRANANLRIGGYLDQNLSTQDPRGINLDDSSPMAGVFGVWSQRNDGIGYEVKVAAGFSDKDVTVTRAVINTSEAGKGSTSFRAAALSATVSYGQQLGNSRWIAAPYLGLRYNKIKRNGYSEDSEIDKPLTYADLSQETTTALAGLRFNGKFGDKINLMASAGIENDIAHNTGDYAATGVAGLTPIAFNQNIRHVRPVASVGASYAIDKRQTVVANLNYRQEAFNSSNSVSGMVTYQVGF